MKIKEGVKLSDLSLEMYPAVCETNKVYEMFGYELTITSTADGIHQADSLHPFGYAFDCRINDIKKEDIQRVFNTLMYRLSVLGYQVILETDHIHIEDEETKDKIYEYRNNKA